MDTPQNIAPVSNTRIALRVGVVGLVAFLAGVAAQHSWSSAPKRTAASTPHKEFSNYDGDRYWAGKIRAGGYILYVRHAQREKWEDVTGFDMVELVTQADGSRASYKRAVCLTEQGIEESKLIGEVFRLAEIKVDKIVSSPSCRSRQTAMYAFGRVDAIANSLLHRTAVMRDQHEEFARDLRRIIDRLEPKPGSNVVLSGHAGTFRFDKGILLDKDETGDPDGRHETGFVVLEKANGKLIARHKFLSIRHLANATIKLPLEYKDLNAQLSKVAN
jgi:broad specificity phosphatase PhoE